MAGAGYKLFNTGDVLTAAQVNTYLQEQTVMVFADAATRTTALSGVLAEGMMSYLKSTDSVEVYNGSAWVSVSSDQTPLTTKGDLFTFTTTDARLAVGNNGETLVADSSASTGLRYTAGNPIANPVINSAFQIAQRGTSFTVGNGYTLDRWYAFSGGAGRTISRQLTNDTTNLPNIQYCARVQRDNGNSATNDVQFYNVFENINSIPFAGKTLTLSFYARKGANYAPSSANALECEVTSGTGTDQNPINGFTGENKFINSNVTLTTTWQRFTVTGTMPATATQMYVRFRVGGNAYTGTAGAADYYEVTGVQIDVGSVALPFRTNGATLAGELAACQRYYWRTSAGVNGTENNMAIAVGGAFDSTVVTYQVNFPVSMRTVPSSIDFANLDTYRWSTVGGAAVTSLAFQGNRRSNVAANVNATSSAGAFTANAMYQLQGNGGGSSFLGFSAEL